MAGHGWKRVVRAAVMAVAAVLTVAAVASPSASDVSTTATAGAYAPTDWPMGAKDFSGSRHANAETAISATKAGSLRQLWHYKTGSAVHGTPAVVDEGGRNYIYAASFSGRLDKVRDDGTAAWTTYLPGTITASPLVARGMVIVGDLEGTIYGVDAATGTPRWARHPNTTGTPAVWGPATYFVDKAGRPVAAVPIASLDEVQCIPGDPTTCPLAQQTTEPVICCRFRGSVAALDPSSGTVLWHTYTVTEAEAAAGGSGAGVWSAPVYDAVTDKLHVTTGNNLSGMTVEGSTEKQSTSMSDAFLLLRASDGAIEKVNQRTKGDIWTFADGPGTGNVDIADSPNFVTLPRGVRLVTAGQKNGVYHVLRADTLEEHSPSVQLVTNGEFFPDAAFADERVYANATNGESLAIRMMMNPLTTRFEPKVEWRFTATGRADSNLSGTAIANGVVVFMASPGLFEDNTAVSSRLHALDARTGKPLLFEDPVTKSTAGLPLPIASVSGPSVSKGRVYAGLGYALSGPPTANVNSEAGIVAFGL